MGRRQLIGHAGWVAFALFAVLTILDLAAPGLHIPAAVQGLATAGLVVAFAASTRAWGATSIGALVAMLLAWGGDTLPLFTPGSERAVAAALFLGAVGGYAIALAPMWLRTVDGLRLLLAVPYAAVILGLVIACGDGAGHLRPLVLAYAVTLALMAFLAAGVNALTWVGGTLLLMSSSVLGMSWFLPGAWVPHAEMWVMLAYFAGHAALVAGILRAVAVQPRRAGRDVDGFGGATLVIVEG